MPQMGKNWLDLVNMGLLCLYEIYQVLPYSVNFKAPKDST